MRHFARKLERTSVLMALCAAFKETTDPPICLNGGIETNECLENNGGCWQDKQTNITACKDTFRGRVCECPVVAGVQYQGDGYTSCKAQGPGRCSINNGGCWSDMRNGKAFSACLFLAAIVQKASVEMDTINVKILMNARRTACQCPGCSCKNTWGGYDCKCGGNRLYMKNEDTCIERNPAKASSYMNSEIMAIMSQYMPLDSQNSRNDEVNVSE
ncbi:Vacuolar-sorting receptor 7 [Bienertia sinuspersici]